MTKGDVTIVAPPDGKGYGFAKGVYDYIRGKPERNFPIRLNHLNRKTFDDEESKVMVEDNVRKSECFYIQDSNRHPDDWMKEMEFALDALKFSSPLELAVVIPYMRFSRQERKSESRVGVSAKVVAKLVSEYADRAIVVDLHAPQIQSFFDVPADNLYSLPTFVDYLIQNHPKMLDNLAVVAPDVGAAKRAGSLLKKLKQKNIAADMVIGHKIKEKDNVERIELIGSVRDKNCMLLDDIIGTGKTMVLAGRECKTQGASAVHAYATHGLFTKGLNDFAFFDKVFTSDTLYHEPSQNLEVVSLVPLFGEAIYKTVVGDSLSALFDR